MRELAGVFISARRGRPPQRRPGFIVSGQARNRTRKWLMNSDVIEHEEIRYEWTAPV